mmetsp:Transcript_26073/g.65688  ORF Transcript_26073/g.65688 Transcript_26073/m.65688 type:complete len:273 (-) Transcript_26073:547-1365(-)
MPCNSNLLKRSSLAHPEQLKQHARMTTRPLFRVSALSCAATPTINMQRLVDHKLTSPRFNPPSDHLRAARRFRFPCLFACRKRPPKRASSPSLGGDALRLCALRSKRPSPRPKSTQGSWTHRPRRGRRASSTAAAGRRLGETRLHVCTWPSSADLRPPLHNLPHMRCLLLPSPHGWLPPAGRHGPARKHIRAHTPWRCSGKDHRMLCYRAHVLRRLQTPSPAEMQQALLLALQVAGGTEWPPSSGVATVQPPLHGWDRTAWLPQGHASLERL